MTQNKITIIAEAGVNHNGSLKTAEKIVDKAKETGADIVKFQVFKTEAVMVRDSPKADYQKVQTDDQQSQFDMVKALELDYKAHAALFEYCKKKGIHYLASPFDLGSVDFLADLGVGSIKIPSGEITNLPYLEKIGQLRKKIILSSGMANLEEIRFALDILETSGTGRDLITVLHCTTEYPAPFEEVHLRAMQSIANAFPGIQVGYSDHTVGHEIAIAAVAMGAMVIEKHFTLDNSMSGPDHKASMEPQAFKGMVRALRNVEVALGCAKKTAGRAESKNSVIARKSIVASRYIGKGKNFSRENLTVKRPGEGISPTKWYEVIGKKAKKDFYPDDIIVL